MVVYLSWGEGLLRARSNWRHAVAVTLPIIGESNKIKLKTCLVQNVSNMNAQYTCATLRTGLIETNQSKFSVGDKYTEGTRTQKTEKIAPRFYCDAKLKKTCTLSVLIKFTSPVSSKNYTLF